MDQRTFSFCHPLLLIPTEINSFFTLYGVICLELYNVLFESQIVKVGNAVSNIWITVILIMRILFRLNICSNYYAETPSLTSVLPQFQLGISPKIVTVIFLWEKKCNNNMTRIVVILKKILHNDNIRKYSTVAL